jgi:hypothetical protein
LIKADEKKSSPLIESEVVLLEMKMAKSINVNSTMKYKKCYHVHFINGNFGADTDKTFKSQRNLIIYN